ncbi:MAG: AAA family ATPase [Caulobacterales bacterium]|nr:AAA family ATPase [Caulobacterales bacterium]
MKRRPQKLDALPESGLLFVRKGQYDALAPSLDFIPGMLHDSTVAIIYGPSGCGKTFFALHLLCSVALGRPLFGDKPEKRRGLYVGLEGEANIKARIQAWCVANGADSNPIHYALGAFHIGDDDDVANLIDRMQQCETQFVVIDTLSIAMAGLDEIAGQHMTLVVNALHRIKRETGACVVALAHTGKNEKAGIRGHSSQLGNVDTTIEIVCHNKETVREGNKKHVIEHEVTLATPRSANVRKQRDGEGNRKWPFVLALKETALTDARGRPVTSPAVDECEQFADLDADAEAASPAKHLSKSDRAAMAVLSALIAKHERHGLGTPKVEQFRKALRRAEWRQGDKPNTWRPAFKRLLDKLEVDSNGGISHAL